MRRAAEYVLRIVSVLGLVPAASDRLSSFNVDSSSGAAAGADAWRPFVDAFSDFRETVGATCECSLCGQCGLALRQCGWYEHEGNAASRNRFAEPTLAVLQVRKEARGQRAKQAPADAFQDILAACDRWGDYCAVSSGRALALPAANLMTNVDVYMLPGSQSPKCRIPAIEPMWTECQRCLDSPACVNLNMSFCDAGRGTRRWRDWACGWRTAPTAPPPGRYFIKLDNSHKAPQFWR